MFDKWFGEIDKHLFSIDFALQLLEVLNKELLDWILGLIILLFFITIIFLIRHLLIIKMQNDFRDDDFITRVKGDSGFTAQEALNYVSIPREEIEKNYGQGEMDKIIQEARVAILDTCQEYHLRMHEKVTCISPHGKKLFDIIEQHYEMFWE